MACNGEAPGTGPARFELYAFWRTSATYRVRVAMRLKGLRAEERQVDLIGGAQHDPEFLRVNPMAAIPALVDRAPGAPAEALTQSLAILEFLEEVADTHPMLPPRVRKYLAGALPGFGDAEWRNWQAHWFTTGLQAFEKRLNEPGTGRFCHGNDVTMADICLASVIVVMRVFGITVPAIPTVTRIMAECEALDAFAASDPMRQAGAPGA